MRREEIIAKGAYTAPQFEELVSVKQFIMLRRKGAKYLLLRLHNDRAERADTVCFKVKQYDVKGSLIATETVVKRNLSIEGGEDATLNGPIKLNRACIDFTVEMVYAEYGDYTYRLHDGALSASYENRSDTPPVDKEQLSKQMHGESSRVSARTLNAPKLLVASMAAILLIVGIFAAVQLKNFMATEEFFTLSSVDFRFVTDDHETGPISIVAYNGKAGNIVIPTSIEGHPVASIDDGAFEGRMLRSVTVKGSPSIGQNAFASCHLLSTVVIPEVTELGAGAFSNCRSLKNVILNDSLTVIPSSAFAGCTSLAEISLPTQLVSLGDRAFAGCTELTEIILPDTLADMGEGVLAGCHSLTALTSPYAGLDKVGKDKVGYFFGGSDQIPQTLRSIVITQATSIGSNAFLGCGGVVSIRLPKAVTHIGDNAFGGCARLTDLTLPDTVTSIGSGAFRSCTSLIEVVIPAGVRVIPQSAFLGCSGLKSISLPAELETIEHSAFKDCSALARLDVPSSVTTIKADALNGCTSLETLTIPFMGESAEKAAPLNSLFGETTHALKTLTVRNAGEIPDYAFAEFDALTAVSLYGNAERIGEYAFENCSGLQSVLLPEATSEIGAHAFVGCSSLASIQLPANLSAISEGMFEDCTSLHAVTVPDAVQTVEAYAFSGCSSLKDASWLSGVESVGAYAFSSCTSLEAALLPPELEKIEKGTFSGCASLQTVSLPTTVTVIDEQAFCGCSALTSVTLPEKAREILKEAFADCEALTAITIPSSVSKLGEEAFAGCSSIRELTVPSGVTEIGQNLVNRCVGLETLTIPFMGSTQEEADKLTYLAESVPTRLQYVRITNATSLADEAFSDCSFVESILLPNSLLSVGNRAFQNCSGLKSLTLPEAVTEIGSGAFSGCTSLKEIYIPSSVTRLESNMLAGCTSLEKITIPFIGQSPDSSRTLSYFFSEQATDPVPPTLTEVTLTNASSIAASAFEGCTQITTITLNCDLKTIGDRAFGDCTSLCEMILPDTVESIGDYAFEYCSGIQRISIPASATYIGYYALNGCYALEELEIPFVGTSRDNDTTLATLFDPYGYGNIPGSLKKVTVTNSNYVKDSAFSNCSGISEIVYDCDVTTIGSYAFDNCSSMTQFSIPDTVVSIGEYAFRSCHSLQGLSLPGALERIETGAFESCSGIRALTIPASVTYMGYYALYGCDTLEELEIPFVGTDRNNDTRFYEMFGGWSGSVPSNLHKVTVTDSSTVKAYAFSDCSNIQEIVYDCDVTAIGNYAFSYCYSLTDFSVPETVERIGDSAFYYCHSLAELSLPDTLEQVGSNAFTGCSRIRTLAFPASVTDIGYNALSDCSSLEELEIPFVGTSRDNDTTLTALFDRYWNGSVPGSLKKVTVTDSSTVKAYAFSDCSNIQEIVYDCDVTAIGNYAFSYCYSLAEFTIPDTVESIGEYTFYSCTSLEELSIPDSIVSIGANAFENCSQIRALSIPTSVTYIGYNALRGCSSLEELELPFVGTSRDNDTTLTALFDPYGYGNIPSRLKKVTVTNSTTVKDYAFQSCYYVEEVVYTQDITSIGSYAFQSCHALRTLDIGESFQSIGSYAFESCYALKSFTFPETCQSVGRYAFSGAYALYEVYNQSALTFGQWNDDSGLLDNCLVYRDSDAEVTKASIDGFVFLLADDGSWYVIDYTGENDTLSFPAAISVGESESDSYRIAQFAFHNRQTLRSVTLPAAVVQIGDQAFAGCYDLREVYDLSPLTITRGDYGNGEVALNAYIVHTSSEEEPLTTVTINDLEFTKSNDTWLLIGYNGPGGDITLDFFTYEGKEVPSYEVLSSAFGGNYGITSLTITDAVKHLGDSAFSNMGSLQYVIFEENNALTHIPEYAFAWCYELKRITLPSTLTEIAYNAFWECTSLREVYNLSPLDLTIGSNDHGCVAKYALIIHDSLSDPPLTEVSIGSYQFLNSGDVWMLEKYDGTDANIVLGSFSYNGATVNAYSVLPGAFQGNPYIEHVQIGDQVKSIGMNAFNNCYSLKTVSFENNTSITDILPGTFASNANLEQIVLPSGLIAIGETAFEGCVNLLEIYNLSNLSLTVGDYGNGSVARYAKVIHTSMSEESLEIVNMDQSGYTYKFILEGGVWSMFARVRRDGYDGRYVLPELVIDGAVTSYQVTASLSGYSSIVIPASVSHVNWNSFSGYNIFYMGTAQQFDALTEGVNTDSYSVRYYVECVHGEGQWTYSSDGSIITDPSCSATVIQENTCSQKGVTRYTCYRCQESWDQENESFAPHTLEAYDGGYACLVCDKRFVTISLHDVWNVTNDAANPFTITEDGEIVSTNQDDNSSATITLEAKESMVFTYRYYVSTEDNCDMLIVRKNGIDITYAGGTMEKPVRELEIAVSAGDVITVTYSKDGSVSRGEDLVKILDLVYFVEEAGDNNA
ncbi:MAG: leucine-rich repeat domain-containing protein [Clostridia bacterium]|nr:leucine-rich repeat domain-containing protein [Clostridia bacterium]